MRYLQSRAFHRLEQFCSTRSCFIALHQCPNLKSQLPKAPNKFSCKRFYSSSDNDDSNGEKNKKNPTTSLSLLDLWAIEGFRPKPQKQTQVHTPSRSSSLPSSATSANPENAKNSEEKEKKKSKPKPSQVNYFIIPVSMRFLGQTTLGLALNRLFPSWRYILEHTISPTTLDAKLKALITDPVESPYTDFKTSKVNFVYLDAPMYRSENRAIVLEKIKEFTSSLQNSESVLICLDFFPKTTINRWTRNVLYNVMMQRVWEEEKYNGRPLLNSRLKAPMNAEATPKRTVEVFKHVISSYNRVRHKRHPDNLFDKYIELDFVNEEEETTYIHKIFKSDEFSKKQLKHIIESLDMIPHPKPDIHQMTEAIEGARIITQDNRYNKNL